MRNISQSIKEFQDHKIIGILLLGFASGLPFLLTLSTLHAWLSRVGISKTTIGLFAIATCPYAFKFVIAPLVDHIKIPFLTDKLGKRRAWIVFSQVCLIFSLIGLGLSDPSQNIIHTFVMTFLVTVFAANQDNAIEAYRIEVLAPQQLGPGASASIIGFRFGMWLSGGGALYLAVFYSWFWVYLITASFMLIGIAATLFMPAEPTANPERSRLRFTTQLFQSNNWLLVFAFIVLFKLSDSALNMMSIPFLLETGFSELEIANIAKSFGMVTMISGGFLGGILLWRYGIIHNLILAMLLVLVSSMMFMLQTYVGYNTSLLVATMGIENLASGMCTTALIAYISQICPRENLATNFAIYSSYISLSRIGISAISGWAADHMSWLSFYATIGMLCLPCLLILVFFAGAVFKEGEYSKAV